MGQYLGLIELQKSGGLEGWGIQRTNSGGSLSCGCSVHFCHRFCPLLANLGNPTV